jgi:hypothetical protein
MQVKLLSGALGAEIDEYSNEQPILRIHPENGKKNIICK